MVYHLKFLFIVMMGWMLPFQAIAKEENSPHVKMELILEEETIQPGRPFTVALHLNIEEGWHVYWKNPGDAGIPIKIEWKLPEGFQSGPLEWPVPEKFTVAEMMGFGYEKEVVFLTQITPPQSINPSSLEIEALGKWLVCSSLACQPGSGATSIPLKASLEEPLQSMQFKKLFSDSRGKIPVNRGKCKIIQKEGIIQIEVPKEMIHSEKGTLQQVSFFPEENDLIDYSTDPVLSSAGPDEKFYCITLKRSTLGNGALKNLRGVLVFHEERGNSSKDQAFNLDSPIHEEESRELSMLSPSEHSSYSGAVDPAPAVTSPSSFDFEGGLFLALIFAFMGGMILNLMPCVLPVMSFKVMSFVKMAGQSRSLTFKHGLMFSLGVVLSFWVLASAMLFMRAYGQSVGWGFQLQEPIFVVILASLLFIFSLSLFGLFEWGMFFASWAGQKQADNAKEATGYGGSFFSGILATAVATPCTGPFLGSAVGFAVTLPVFSAMLIFTFLALGMCFPYLLLAAFPSYLRFLPKPGPWMETFKQMMGFLLLATVLWLLWVFSAQTDTFSLMCLLAGFLSFSIGAWIYGRGCSPVVKRKTRLFAFALVGLFAYMGCRIILFPEESWSQPSISQSKGTEVALTEWEDFSPERVAELRSQGKPILIDFTAKWCLICQTNHLVLDSPNVKKQLNASGVVKMKADWTKNDPVITEALSKFGRNSVPLYVLYGTNEAKDPVILPQVLTPDVVAAHINKVIPTEEVALEDKR